MKRSEKARIRALIETAIEAAHHDHEGEHHLRRASRLCRALAQALARHPERSAEVTPEFISRLRTASMLHDIGKLDVPAAILTKPGSLTPSEFKTIQTHADAGAKRLETALAEDPDNETLRMSIDLARHHHERWNGDGYPDGLSGEAIPLAARIMSVVDVYDALRAQRPYKRPFTHPLTMDVIVAESGKQFDPAVVEALVSIADRFARIRRRLPD